MSTATKRPCACESPDCPKCRAWRMDPAYRALYGGGGPRSVHQAPVLADCPGCPGNTRIKVQEQMPVESLLKLLDGPPLSWPAGWETWPATHEAHRQLLDRWVAEPEDPPGTDVCTGRGIVISAGGPVYFTAAWVCVRILRQLGCRLPIEVWFLGREEMDFRMQALLEALGDVSVIDSREVARGLARPPRLLGGWGNKVFSILHSRFAEVLYLDADQVPVQDPAYLFDLAPYREAGAVFWPDLTPHGWTIARQGFQTAGLAVPGNRRDPRWQKPTDYIPFESGQVLVDKTRHAHALTVALRLNEHSDYWYKHLYGDKDTFWLAWHKSGSAFAMPGGPGWTGSNDSGAFLQEDFAGHLWTQHRCQPYGKKYSLHGHNPDTSPRGLVHWEWVLEALADLRGRWLGRPHARPLLAVVTGYTESWSALAPLAEAKRAYCRRHGYGFHLHKDFDPTRPPSWSKLKFLQAHLSDYEWLFWSDADAAIVDPAVPLERFVDGGSDLIFGRHEEEQLNAGNFFIRGCHWSRTWLEAIWAQARYTDHPMWEQQAMQEMLPTYREHVRFWPVGAFNSIRKVREPGDFILHAAGVHDPAEILALLAPDGRPS